MREKVPDKRCPDAGSTDGGTFRDQFYGGVKFPAARRPPERRMTDSGHACSSAVGVYCCHPSPFRVVARPPHFRVRGKQHPTSNLSEVIRGVRATDRSATDSGPHEFEDRRMVVSCKNAKAVEMRNYHFANIVCTILGPITTKIITD